MAQGEYHHGRLSEAAIELGVIRLQHQSLDSLTVTDLAKEIGVSSTAILSHFGSLSNLKSQIAKRCRDLFNQASYQHRMTFPVQPWAPETACKLLDSYFDFWLSWARANPYLYECSWQRYGASSEPEDTGRGPSVIRGAIAELSQSGIFVEDRIPKAEIFWMSAVHGYAALNLMVRDHPSSVFSTDVVANDLDLKRRLRQTLLLPEFHT